MLETIKGLFSTAKLYIYIAVLSVLTTAWAMDRHNQYEKGVTDTVAKIQKAEIEKAPPAVLKADEARKEVNEIQSTKQTDLVQIHEASAKANHPTECVLSSDELFILNSKIDKVNTSSPSSNGKLSSIRSSSSKSKSTNRVDNKHIK